MGNATSQSTTKGSSSNNGTNSSSKRSKKGRQDHQQELAARAQQVVGESVRELQAGIQSGIKRLEEQDHPAAQILDTLCSPYLDASVSNDRDTRGDAGSVDSEDVESEDSRTISEDETTLTDYQRSRNRHHKVKERGERERNKHHHHHDERSLETGSYHSQSDGYESSTVVTADDRLNNKMRNNPKIADPDDSTNNDTSTSPLVMTQKPLASAFAKRCYFTKQGIGGQSQHYEGLTLTGNVVLMLASAMKLKGCPTICDEDLRRVEQTYPNQFSRLPDELLLSSGWRRISKYCHFSNKPIPDGSPFFHSKQRLHPSGGYYFLLAAAVGMVRPIDVEPLTRDTLVLLETDFPSTCDAAPDVLIQDPDQWTLVDKFCFFSGGPINTDEDVYYQADFDGNPIYMLAFLSPSLTPAELYKLDIHNGHHHHHHHHAHDDSAAGGLRSVAAVEEVESVYDLTDRDFDDLKLYHLGPCRALPQYILQPLAWTKVLPPHFLAARQTALLRAQEFEQRQQQHHQQHSSHHRHHHSHHHPNAGTAQQQQQQHRQTPPPPPPRRQSVRPTQTNDPYEHEDEEVADDDEMETGPLAAEEEEEAVSYYDDVYDDEEEGSPREIGSTIDRVDSREFARQVEEEGAFVDDSNIPMDEAIAAHAASQVAPPTTSHLHHLHIFQHHNLGRMDPPEDDEPPSLSKQRMMIHDEEEEEQHHHSMMHEEHQQQHVASSYYPEYDNAEYYEEEEEEYYDSKEPGNYYVSGDKDNFPSALSPDSFSSPDSFPSVKDEEEEVQQQEHHLHLPESPERRNNRRNRSELPPTSPRSLTSEQSSAAMREAQDILRRNRQRRYQTNPNAKLTRLVVDGEDGENPALLTSPNTDSESGTTWESGSDFTGSSVWTDHSQSNNMNSQRGIDQRSSRRALILQMAKARMKSNKLGVTTPASSAAAGGGGGTYKEEEKKVDDRFAAGSSDGADLDLLAGELD